MSATRDTVTMFNTRLRTRKAIYDRALECALFLSIHNLISDAQCEAIHDVIEKRRADDLAVRDAIGRMYDV